MKIKQKSIVAVVFLAFIGVLFFAIPGNYLYARISIFLHQENNTQTVEENNTQTSENNKTNRFDIDWEKLYPFEDPAKNIKKTTETEPGDIFAQNKLLSRYKTLSLKITDYFESRKDSYFLLKDEDIVYWYGKINKLIGMNFIKDTETTTVNYGNGYLGYRSNGGKNNDVAIQNTIDFSSWLKEKGIDFLFVSAPSKVVDERYSITNINLPNAVGKEKLCNTLKSNGVNVLNISEYMPNDYGEYLSFFYKTDHHWKTETGFWATGIIAKELNQKFGFNIDCSLLEQSKYQTIVYSKLFLGSQGKKVGLGYIDEPDDFSLIVPMYENHLHVFIPRNGIDTDGDFLTLINTESLEKNNPYIFGGYGSYTYGDQPIIQIFNKEAACKKKILIIKDSYANAVVPYLALVNEKIDVIDLRGSESMKCFSGSLKTYINQNDYDMVLYIIAQTGAGNAKSINNTESFWYFE